LSNKVRIHDLAKLYGMQGKDLATKLRDLGFSQAKSHMSALDEFEVLQARGILEANGIRPVGKEIEGEEEDGAGTLLLRKKKKKAPGKAGESVADEEEPEVEAPTIAEPVAEEERARPHVFDEPVHSTHSVEPAPAAFHPASDEDDAHAPELADSELEEEVFALGEVDAEPSEALAMEDAGTAELSIEAPAAPAETGTPAGPQEREVLQPAAAGRIKGRVLGFIDPANFQRPDASKDKKRPESRRLRSGDEEAAPEVQPTFTHDRNRAMLRGAGVARGDLTSSCANASPDASCAAARRPPSPAPLSRASVAVRPVAVRAVDRAGDGTRSRIRRSTERTSRSMLPSPSRSSPKLSSSSRTSSSRRR
jgi:hypothetical protein